MSAYIVQPEHAGLLAAWATYNHAVLPELVVGEPLLTAQNVARELIAENIKSVAHRYPDTSDGDRPGPNGLLDAQIIEAAALWAGHYLQEGTPESVAPATVKSLVDSLEYQSEEHDDFESSLARRQIGVIRFHARNCPGRAVARAPWSWSDSNPELDALIYGKEA